MVKRETAPRPFYREFWFWVVMTPLIVVVLVVAVLLTVAIRGADDTVIDNYYKQGRLINQTFDQDLRATALGLSAQLEFIAESGEVTLEMTANEQMSFPGQLLLLMDHPAEADKDQQIVLRRVGANQYAGPVEDDFHGSWYVTIYPELNLEQRRQAEWRLRDDFRFEAGRGRTIKIEARPLP